MQAIRGRRCPHVTFEERLRDSFEQMVAYRHAVGYATATYRSSVPPFIDHYAKNYADSTVVTREMVDSWLSSYPYSVNSRAAFISLLREYTKYLHFLGYGDYIPDEEYSTKRIAFQPYLFIDDELRELFSTIDSYTLYRFYQWEKIPSRSGPPGIFTVSVLLRDASAGTASASLQGCKPVHG